MSKKNILFIGEDCKNLEGENVLNEVHKYNEIHLLGISTNEIKKIVDKGKNSIATLVLHSCYLDLKYLVKLKKLTLLHIIHGEDMKKLYGYKFPKLKGVYKQWYKKNKWMGKNTKKNFCLFRYAGS